MKWEGFEGPATYQGQSARSVNTSLLEVTEMRRARGSRGCRGAGCWHRPHRVLLSLTVSRRRGPREVRGHQGCDAGASPHRRPRRGAALCPVTGSGGTRASNTFGLPQLEGCPRRPYPVRDLPSRLLRRRGESALPFPPFPEVEFRCPWAFKWRSRGGGI